MADRSSVEQLMTDLTRAAKSAAALRYAAPALHPGVETAAVPLLFKLSAGPLRVGRLAELVHSDISTVSRQVGPLVARGLVVKRPDPDDGRAQQLELTATGLDAAAKLRSQRAAILTAVLADWTDEKIAAASAAFGSLADALDEALSDPDELRRRLPPPVEF